MKRRHLLFHTCWVHLLTCFAHAFCGERSHVSRHCRLKIASDNGSAFLSDTLQEFARLLEVELLRTRVWYPEENGRCERLIRTIKEEEVWLNEYETHEEARRRLATFADFYNAERIHSVLGYIAPRQYVALWRDGRAGEKAA